MKRIFPLFRILKIKLERSQGDIFMVNKSRKWKITKIIKEINKKIKNNYDFLGLRSSKFAHKDHTLFVGTAVKMHIKL